MREKMGRITNELVEIKKENETFRETLLQENKELKNITENMQQEIEKLKEEKINLSLRISQLERTTEREEKQKRRENIIIKGSSFQEENLKENITKYLNKKLEIEIEVSEAYLIGKGTNKNVIAKLKNFNQKLDVLKNKRKLQQEKIFIQSDMTVREREIQANLREIAREEREKGNIAKVGYNYIVINKAIYDWNEMTQSITERSKN